MIFTRKLNELKIYWNIFNFRRSNWSVITLSFIHCSSKAFICRELICSRFLREIYRCILQQIWLDIPNHMKICFKDQWKCISRNMLLPNLYLLHASSMQNYQGFMKQNNICLLFHKTKWNKILILQFEFPHEFCGNG